MKTAHDLVAQAKTLTHEISVNEAENAILEADLLIDVREADEYAAGQEDQRKLDRRICLRSI
jgi:transcription elongation GreA/GreB family factor